MAFPFLVVLTNVNAKLNNPDGDQTFGSETSASEIKEDETDDFPPVEEEFQNNKEPEREPEPVYTQSQEQQPEPEPKPQPEPVVAQHL